MFQLTKWYLDVISADGAAFIGYHAHLRWRRLALDYAADLHAPPSAETCARWTVRPNPPPRLCDGRLRWLCAPLQLQGEWRPRAPGLRRLLHSEAGAIVDWHCIAPRAAARVRRAGALIRGTGYVERIRLSIPPWRLPLDTLLWGRFHAPGHTLVWLEWRGAKPLTLVLYNGGVHCAAHITRDLIDIPAAGLRLALSDHRLIRAASIAGTVTEAVPALAAALPTRFRHAREHKLMSRGTLFHEGRAAAGWALHEEVTWR